MSQLPLTKDKQVDKINRNRSQVDEILYELETPIARRAETVI